jgi:hypothetical protein
MGDKDKGPGPRPVFLSDGYRTDSCARCGKGIGYGRFTAILRDGRWVLMHEDEGCERW